jgi:hypothetical protein
MPKTFTRAMLAAGLALAAMTVSAQAAPVVVSDVALAPKVQTKFHKVYGEREIAPLMQYAKRQIQRELTKAGATVGSAGLRLETTLTSATANKPTFKQLGDTPGLDYMRSISIGGSRLTAKFIDQSGAVVGEVEGGYYENDIRFVYSGMPWADAERGMRLFATKVGERYRALSQGGASS